MNQATDYKDRPGVPFPDCRECDESLVFCEFRRNFKIIKNAFVELVKLRSEPRLINHDRVIKPIFSLLLLQLSMIDTRYLTV